MDYLKKTSPFHGGPSMEDKKPIDAAEQVKSVLGGLKRG